MDDKSFHKNFYQSILTPSDENRINDAASDFFTHHMSRFDEGVSREDLFKVAFDNRPFDSALYSELYSRFSRGGHVVQLDTVVMSALTFLRQHVLSVEANHPYFVHHASFIVRWLRGVKDFTVNSVYPNLKFPYVIPSDSSQGANGKLAQYDYSNDVSRSVLHLLCADGQLSFDPFACDWEVTPKYYGAEGLWDAEFVVLDEKEPRIVTVTDQIRLVNIRRELRQLELI